MNTNKNGKFSTTQQINNDTCTVFLSGELDLSVAPEFRQVMEPLASNEKLGLILNLKDLQYIDSTGIGIILSVLKLRHRLGAAFYVQEVPSQIQKLFEMTGISKFISTQENSQ